MPAIATAFTQATTPTSSNTPFRAWIIESLKEEREAVFIWTPTGAGCYQLSGEHAERTGEYLEGIVRIWQQDDLPAELEPYIGVVNHFNCNGQLRLLPGSPLIAPSAAA